MPKRHTVKPNEYHLIDIGTGESHGGFISLEAARLGAMERGLRSWQIFRGNLRLEHHDPDGVGAARDGPS